MKTKTIITVLLVSFCLASCAPAVTITPIETAMPTETSIPTITPSPTNTSIPSSTPTPQPTRTPEPPYIPDGTIYYLWGLNYDWENTTTPYLVFGAQLRDAMNGNCEGFICGGKDLREYNPTVWLFLGRGEYGKAVFTSEIPLDTFIIVWGSRMGFDALSGITIDGGIVTYGYLVNGQITASYLDGSNFPSDTIGSAEKKGIPVNNPCGIIDPNPDGDNNYNLTGNYGGWSGGAIVWNFLDRGFYNSPFATRKGYSLISLTIISQPASKITSDQICP